MFNSNSSMPYPTHSCVVIEPIVSFKEFLVQLEQFDQWIINNDQQRVAYELLFEESSYREIPTQPSITIALLESIAL